MDNLRFNIKSVFSQQFIKKYIIPWALFCLLAITVAFFASWIKKQNAIPEWNPSVLDFIPGQRNWLVLDIIDGDSIVIRYKGKMNAVQLLHVNAPDRGNPLFIESRNFLRELIEDERVEMVFPEGHEFEKDFFGRYLAYIKVGKLDVNQKMIEEGYAKIKEDDGHIGQYEKLKQLQSQAQAAQKNIWSSTENSQYRD